MSILCPLEVNKTRQVIGIYSAKNTSQRFFYRPKMYLWSQRTQTGPISELSHHDNHGIRGPGQVPKDHIGDGYLGYLKFCALLKYT